MPFGLRTVDGSFNNLVPGQSEAGAADNLFPRLVDPVYRDDADGDTFDANGPAPGGVVDNTDYGTPGNVADADPRTISNLIVDQTIGNPAAIAAALAAAGSEDVQADMAAIIAARDALADATAAAASSSAAIAALFAALEAAQVAAAGAVLAEIQAQAEFDAAQLAFDDATALVATNLGLRDVATASFLDILDGSIDTPAEEAALAALEAADTAYDNAAIAAAAAASTLESETSQLAAAETLVMTTAQAVADAQIADQLAVYANAAADEAASRHKLLLI